MKIYNNDGSFLCEFEGDLRNADLNEANLSYADLNEAILPKKVCEDEK